MARIPVCVMMLCAALAHGYTQRSPLKPSSETTMATASRSPLFAVTRQLVRNEGSTRTRLDMVGHAFDSSTIKTVDKLSSTLAPSPPRPTSRVKEGPSLLSPLEILCVLRLERWYNIALKSKCPFLRRRMTDMIDFLEAIMRSMIIRQAHLPLIGPPMGCRGDPKTRHIKKYKGLSLEQLMETIRKDWKEETHKGYYVTGKLNTTIYRNDAYFDGPDPDMPVRGLRKFLNAASQLFDQQLSTCELLSLNIQEQGHGADDDDVIVARWRMNGVLRLPWKPKMPEVVGTTIYRLDENHLIRLHEETWDISAVEAFFRTKWLDFSNYAGGSYHT